MNNNSLPHHASVVVIGGGVMGCSVLYHLAKGGIGDAILLERNRLTSGTTWHSAAQVRALRSSRNLTELIRYSIRLYSRLEEETGQQTGWINKGSLSIATCPDRLVHIQRQQALAEMFGVQAETISGEEAKARWPLMNSDDVIGAVWSPEDGRVSPSDLCAALVKGAKSKGARFFENTEVISIVSRTNNRQKKITAVETPQGTIKCDAIALCTGLWSRDAAAMAGVSTPVYPCEHFYLLTKPIDGIEGNLPTLSDHDNHLYIRDDSGGLLVGCFEPMGKAISPEKIGKDFAFQLLPEDWRHFEPMMERALHRLPALQSAEVKMLLNGPESFTPDGAFMLGEAAETKGLFLGCGMNSVGIASAGGAGMALAHAIRHGSMPMDLHELDPMRFAPQFNDAAALAARVPEVLGKHYEITYPGRQFTTARDLRHLPLHRIWQKEGACFGQIYATERPLYFDKESKGENRYEPPLGFARPAWFEHTAAEVSAATEKAALFDLSSFGKIDVTGTQACDFLNHVCANRMDKAIGRAVYTLMLNPQGGIASDLVAYRMAEEHYRLFVGSAAVRRDMAWLKACAESYDKVAFKDCSETYAVLGLMGPQAADIMTAIGADEFNRLPYFGGGESVIDGMPVSAVRLSYVGEPGWELTCRAEHAAAIYDKLRDCGIVPAGLFAQTSMRIEKRFLAYGHDMDSDLSPLHVGLRHTVDFGKDFIGKQALTDMAENNIGSHIFSLIFSDNAAVPLGNEPVLSDGAIIGKTTSAAYGFRLQAPIALAYIETPEALSAQARLQVNIGGQLFAADHTAEAAFDPLGEKIKL